MVSVEKSLLTYYQRRMEDFYNDLIDVCYSGRFKVYSEVSLEEPYILQPDVELIFFEDILSSESCDFYGLHELLRRVMERGWQIIMNFMEPDCLLGNVAVKIGDKWFAFGQCRKDEDDEPYVVEIWPLKYVLPQISKMEIKPRYTFPVNNLYEDSVTTYRGC